MNGVGMDIPETAEAVLLYHEDMHAHNTFEDPQKVVPVHIDLDPTKPIILPRTAILAIRFRWILRLG